MKKDELIPHLFRSEFSKITTVLGKYLGIEHLQVAEDLASETFLTAMQTWAYKGIPEKPTAWLYVVAKNKAKNYLRRTKVFSDKILPDLLLSEQHNDPADIDLTEKNISDAQLQMLFAICHPVIPPEAQIGLSLRILCGFGIDEIANAFLTSKETINKRLFRAREKLRVEKVRIRIPSPVEISKRLQTVLSTLYLLFNEGYYSESNDRIIREELCMEAIRLATLLINDELTNKPEVNALLALMCFHGSRLEARTNDFGEIILYQDQDETLWNYDLITKGSYFLHEASQGEKLSKYHVEAAIAYWHTIKADTAEKWENILQLFDYLLEIEYSPIAAINRLYALSKVYGKSAAIIAAEKLELKDNHFYYTLLGELYCGTDTQKAIEHYQKALSLARTKTDKSTIQNMIEKLG